MLDNIGELMLGMTILMAVAGGAIGIIRGVTGDDHRRGAMKDESFSDVCLWLRRLVKVVIPVFVVAGIGVTFLPSTKQAAAIIVIPRIYNAIAETPEVAGIPKQIGVLAGEWLEELRPVVKSETGDNE